MAFPSGGGPTSSPGPAAPFTYPTLSPASLAAAGQTQPAPATNPLNAQAASLARGTIADQVAAIQAQQAADRAAAAATAKQIGQASQAAAGFLGPGGYNLGGLASQDYANAIAQTGGLASGYTGQLRDDLAAQAAAAQNTLRSIPGNEQTVTNRGGDLANALYGLRGSLPGQGLAAEGLAATTTARLLPAQFLATGANEALGVLGAGRADAARLDPQLTAARGSLGKLTQSYLGDLVSQQQKNVALSQGQERIDQAAATQQANTVYRNAYLQHLQAGDTERVAHDRANEAAGVAYHNAEIALGKGRLSVSQAGAATAAYNAQTSRINANKPSSSGGFTIGNTRYNADGSVLVKGAGSASGAKRPAGSLTQNEVSGLVDTWSQPQTQSQTLPVVGADGKPVLDTNNVPVTQSQTVTTRQPYTFTQAINQLRGLKVPRADALQAVLSNPVFAAQASTALQGSAAAYAQRGTPLTKALAQIRRASGLPDSFIRPALQQAYQAQAAATARRGPGLYGTRGPTGTPSGSLAGPLGPVR